MGKCRLWVNVAWVNVAKHLNLFRQNHNMERRESKPLDNCWSPKKGPQRKCEGTNIGTRQSQAAKSIQCERKSKYGQTPFTEKAAVRGHSETLLPRWNTTDTYIRALQRLTLVFHIQLCLIDRISVYLILL